MTTKKDQLFLMGKDANGETILQTVHDYLSSPEIITSAREIKYIVISRLGFAFEIHPEIICQASQERAVRCAEALAPVTAKSKPSATATSGWRLPCAEEAMTIGRLAEDILEANSVLGVSGQWYSREDYKTRQLMTSDKYRDSVVIVGFWWYENEFSFSVGAKNARTPGSVIAVRDID